MEMNRFSNLSKTAFTLTELVITITILAILATVGFLAYSGYSDDASGAAKKMNVRTLASYVSAETVSKGETVRTYVSRIPDMEITDAVLFWVPLVAWSYGDFGSNYTAGTPNYSKLGLNWNKRTSLSRTTAYASADSPIFLAAADIQETTISGGQRNRSFFQAAQQLEDGQWTVAWDFPVGAWSVEGLLHNPNYKEEPTAVLVDSTAGAILDVTIPPFVSDISLGHSTSCASTSTGALYCWWYNYYGELGIGNYQDTNVPTLVESLTGATAFKLWQYHACAITSQWGVKCWWQNTFGQLGNWTVSSSIPNPVDVVGIASWATSISVWQLHSCAVVSGEVKCWGAWNNGRLWQWASSSSSVPVTANVGEPAISVYAAHSFTCALTVSWKVKCWGYSTEWQTWNGVIWINTQMTPIIPLWLESGVIELQWYYTHSCAIMQDKSVRCWWNNQFWQLGDWTLSHRYVPTTTQPLGGDIKQLALWTLQTCALYSDNAVKCWGSNSYGQFWNWLKQWFVTSPSQTFGFSDKVSKISVWSNHACASFDNGMAKCWGLNHVWQLWNRIDAWSKVLFQNPLVTSWFSSVSVWWGHVCWLTASGWVKCWGKNTFGQLGNESAWDSSVNPVDVDGMSSWIVSVSTGWNHTCALTSAGEAKCWGYNLYGQIWNSMSWSNVTLPTTVTWLSSGVASLVAWSNNTCAITTSWALKCWWRNNYGQVGDTTKIDKNVPTNVTWASSWIAEVSVWGYHSCLRTTSGAGKCWGYNSYYNLGDGTKTVRTSPVSVIWATVWVARIFAGNQYYTCYLTTSWTVKCVWRNHYGQIGDGSNFIDAQTPVTVSGLDSDVTELYSGNAHSCAKKTDSTYVCWGSNAQWQLWNGTTMSQLSPIPFQWSSNLVNLGLSLTSNGSCWVTLTGGVMCSGNNASWQLGKDPVVLYPWDVTNW